MLQRDLSHDEAAVVSGLFDTEKRTQDMMKRDERATIRKAKISLVIALGVGMIHGQLAWQSATRQRARARRCAGRRRRPPIHAAALRSTAISAKSGLFEPLQHMVVRCLRAELRGEPLSV
jgi:hypothetical protein